MLSKQLSGGGWATPAFLVDWEDYERLDKKPHDPSTPDAYGTGLAIIVAREMGIPAKDQRIQKGIKWLKNNQRQSGSWFTRSPAEDSKHYITNTGTAFAVLALQSCGEFERWPFGK
jgi:squalene-hopene/tetraprenyl-beta-curcumene cyclase